MNNNQNFAVVSPSTRTALAVFPTREEAHAAGRAQGLRHFQIVPTPAKVRGFFS